MSRPPGKRLAAAQWLITQPHLMALAPQIVTADIYSSRGGARSTIADAICQAGFYSVKPKTCDVPVGAIVAEALRLQAETVIA